MLTIPCILHGMYGSQKKNDFNIYKRKPIETDFNIIFDMNLCTFIILKK